MASYNLSEEQKKAIINCVKSSNHKIKYLLKNVEQDHLLGCGKNLEKSYFFKKNEIRDLFVSICDSYDRMFINKQSLVLVKSFPEDIGIVINKSLQVRSHIAVLVIGIKHIFEFNFDPSCANLLTFYPRGIFSALDSFKRKKCSL